MLWLRWLSSSRIEHNLIEDLIRKLFTSPFRSRPIHLVLLLLLHLTLKLLLILSLLSCFFFCLSKLVPSYLIHTSLHKCITCHLPACTLSSLAFLGSLWSKIFVIFLLLLRFIWFTPMLVDIIVANSTYHVLFFEFERLFNKRAVSYRRLVVTLVIGLLHQLKRTLIL